MENRLEILRIEMDKLIMASQSPRIYFSHLYGVSHFCTLLALRRNLNVELATTCGMLHDIANVNGTGGDNHALKGAEDATELLKAINLYTHDEIKLISTAIVRHSDKKIIQEPYDELLKDADVMSHCFYNHDFPVAEWELPRYTNILIELGCTSMACKVYPYGTCGNYKYADIIARHKGKWIFCKHKNRTTWEPPGGHIEKGETPLEAAKRELFEETGAIDFDIEPLCDYWIGGKFNGVEIDGHGQVYFANVHTLADIPHDSEMERICLLDAPPANLTYPEHTREIFPLAAQKRL